jgi:hypothetical protein
VDEVGEGVDSSMSESFIAEIGTSATIGSTTGSVGVGVDNDDDDEVCSTDTAGGVRHSEDAEGTGSTLVSECTEAGGSSD